MWLAGYVSLLRLFQFREPYKSSSASLPFDRLTIFSKKVFWGATSPLRPPAIVPLHSGVCRWLAPRSAARPHGLCGSETLRRFVGVDSELCCRLHSLAASSAQCSGVRCVGASLVSEANTPHHPGDESNAWEHSTGGAAAPRPHMHHWLDLDRHLLDHMRHCKPKRWRPS